MAYSRSRYFCGFLVALTVTFASTFLSLGPTYAASPGDPGFFYSGMRLSELSVFKLLPLNSVTIVMLLVSFAALMTVLVVTALEARASEDHWLRRIWHRLAEIVNPRRGDNGRRPADRPNFRSSNWNPFRSEPDPQLDLFDPRNPLQRISGL